MAHAIARESLPAYAHRFSPKKFTQHQHFACLVLKSMFDLDYRGVVALLSDCTDLCRAIDLNHIPHCTMLQKAARRLLGQRTRRVRCRDPRPAGRFRAPDWLNAQTTVATTRNWSCLCIRDSRRMMQYSPCDSCFGMAWWRSRSVNSFDRPQQHTTMSLVAWRSWHGRHRDAPCSSSM